jgi:hypothetical protein
VEATPWTAAGVLITNGTYVLGGVQQCDKGLGISGIGGSRMDEESYMQTALREMLEELFDIVDVPQNYVVLLEKKFKPTHIFQVKSYISVVYTFTQLESMLKLFVKLGIKSRLYQEQPLKLYELVLYRFPCKQCEIHNLQFLPLYPAWPYEKVVQKDFIQDLKILKTLMPPQVERPSSWLPLPFCTKGLIKHVPNA